MRLQNVLYTMFAIGVIGTAHAADEIITGGAGTCNADVLGTAENGATANTIATWSLNEYDCPAGQYLMVDGENIACTPCASGSYCPGGIFTVESEEKGTYQCPTDYASSVGGSDSQNDCYQGCSATCTQQPVPLHSINVAHGNETASGKRFYGGSCDAASTICSLSFQCDTGYHKRPDLTDEQLVQLLINLSGGSAEDYTPEMLEEIKSETFDNWEVLESEMQDTSEFKAIISAIHNVQHLNEKLPDFEEEFEAYVQLGNDLQSTTIKDPLLNTSGYLYAKAVNNGEEVCASFGNLINYWFTFMATGEALMDCDTLAQQDKFFANFRDSAQNGDWFISIPERNIFVTGQSECNSDGTKYAEAGRATNIQNFYVYTDWVKSADYIYTQEECEGTTAPLLSMGSVLFRIAKCASGNANPGVNCSFASTPVFAGYPDAYITYMCDANKIGIDWNPDDGSENVSGMCLYGGDVNVPDYIPTKPGYTFKGWKLITQ